MPLAHSAVIVMDSLSVIFDIGKSAVTKKSPEMYGVSTVSLKPTTPPVDFTVSRETLFAWNSKFPWSSSCSPSTLM